ncbi:hypothetical protein AAE478_006934 [Parahypoxylon ruwenzoriense]
MNRLPETNAGVVTSWIPIPTTHPSQPGCEKWLWEYVPNVIAAWDPGYGVEIRTDATCLPKPVTIWWMQDHLGPIRETIFSLGPVTCPQDYYTATASAKDLSSTYVACCPINYDFVRLLGPGGTGQCTSAIKKDSIVTYAQRDSGSWKITSSSATEATSAAAIPVNGWIFAAQTGSTTNSANCDAAVSEALATYVETENSSCAAANAGILTPGAAAGIGVGVSLGVTGLAALGAGLFMMYRRRKTDRIKPENERHIAQFAASSGGKGTDTGAQVFPMYSHDARETPNPSKPQQYQPFEPDTWDASTPCLTSHSHARTVPHGEMEGTSYQVIDERIRRRMEIERIPYQRIDDRIENVDIAGTSHPDSDEEIRRRMELEGEFDRNVKVSLSTPWLAAARAAQQQSSSSSSSQYKPPY